MSAIARGIYRRSHRGAVRQFVADVEHPAPRRGMSWSGAAEPAVVARVSRRRECDLREEADG